MYFLFIAAPRDRDLAAAQGGDPEDGEGGGADEEDGRVDGDAFKEPGGGGGCELLGLCEHVDRINDQCYAGQEMGVPVRDSELMMVIALPLNLSAHDA